MSDQATAAQAAASDALSTLKGRAADMKAAVKDRLPTVTTTSGDGPADRELYDILGASRPVQMHMLLKSAATCNHTKSLTVVNCRQVGKLPDAKLMACTCITFNRRR